VVRVTLRKFCNYFNDCETYGKNLEMKDILANFSPGAQINSPCVFVLDGFEKVWADYFSFLDKLFAKISTERCSILVTTRPSGLREMQKFGEFKFKVLRLQPFSTESRIQFLQNRISQLEKNVIEWLDEFQSLDEDFLGNPHHLQKIVDHLDDKNIFAVYDSVLHSLIKKAMVKFESVGKENSMLSTKIRKRRELLIVTAAHLQQLDYAEFKLSPERIKKIEDVGVLSISGNGKTAEYHFAGFRDFLLSLYLIHGSRGEIVEENVKNAMSKFCEPRESSGQFSCFFIESFNFLSKSERDKFGYAIALNRIE